MDDENPTMVARLWQKFNNYETLLKNITERFLESWIGLGILALVIFCGSAFVGMFVNAIPYFLILLTLSFCSYWCWKLLLKRNALVLYIYIGLAILEYILIRLFFYFITRDLEPPFRPDWTTFLILGIILAIPAIKLFWLKRNQILH
jgi:hypothetical protein